MKQRLRQALSQRQKRHLVDAKRVPSAVLLPIYCKDEECYILFTKRTENVKDHKAQISFPGGAYEDGDGTLLDTALRESEEEIGLKAEAVEILGELDDIATWTSNYIVSPFVAAIPWPYPLKINQWETEELIEVPISALMDTRPPHEETRIMEDQTVTSFYYYYRGRVIWGATARILNQFLDVFIEAAQAAEWESDDYS